MTKLPAMAAASVPTNKLDKLNAVISASNSGILKWPATSAVSTNSSIGNPEAHPYIQSMSHRQVSGAPQLGDHDAFDQPSAFGSNCAFNSSLEAAKIARCARTRAPPGMAMMTSVRESSSNKRRTP